MPIDPAYLQDLSPHIQMPQEVEANSLRNLAMRQQVQQGQQSMQDRNALRQLLSNASQGGTVDYGQLGKALLPYDSTAGLHMMQLGEQQNQQKQWQERQRSMLGTPPSQPGMPQAPQPPGAVSPGQPPPGQPPQVSGIFSGYRDNPNPGVVQMAKQGEQLLQQGAFKDPADVNAYVQRIGELDTRGFEGRAAAAERVQAAKDAAQARFEEHKTRIAEAAAGRAQQPKMVMREGENGPELVDMTTGIATPVKSSETGQPLGAKPGAEKALTENQGKATMFGMRASKAHDILGEMSSGPEDDRVTQPGVIKRIGESIPGIGGGVGTMLNWTQSDKQQQVEQAQRDFLTATLRLESGATIGPHEIETGKLQYFPQPGDKPANLAQKKANRETVIEGFKVEAGPGAKNIGGKKAPPPDQPGAAAAPKSFHSLPDARQYKGKTATDTESGTRWKSNGSDWEQVK